MPNLQPPAIGLGVPAYGGASNTSRYSRASAQLYASDWEHHHDREVSAGINPIKLKAMAMRLRHKAQGVKFKKPAVQEAEPLKVNDSLSQRIVEPADKAITHVLGPDNLIGLRTIFMHPMCVLLAACPLGIASDMCGWGATSTFWLNFLALVPLAKILGDATEELAASLNNDTVSGLLNATFGNAVEMIVSIAAIKNQLFAVVKASLLGSVLSNILLVLGTAFFLGGLTKSSRRRGKYHSFAEVDGEEWVSGRSRLEKEQKFPVKGVLISMAMLLFGCMSFALPTIFNAWPTDDAKTVLKVSRIGACITMSSYIAYLVFQLLTHGKTLQKEEDRMEDGAYGEDPDEEVEEDGEAGLTSPCAIFLMALITIVVSVNSEYLVGAINTVVESNGIPEGFIGVILLPIAGNACEHASAIRFAMQDRPGLAIGIAVGSSTQVALMVVPFSVIVAWILDAPLDLDFGALNTAVITFVILAVLVLLLDGRSNWFKGYILCCMYAFIAVLYWFVPNAVPNK